MPSISPCTATCRCRRNGCDARVNATQRLIQLVLGAQAELMKLNKQTDEMRKEACCGHRCCTLELDQSCLKYAGNGDHCRLQFQSSKLPRSRGNGANKAPCCTSQPRCKWVGSDHLFLTQLSTRKCMNMLEILAASCSECWTPGKKRRLSARISDTSTRHHQEVVEDKCLSIRRLRFYME